MIIKENEELVFSNIKLRIEYNILKESVMVYTKGYPYLHINYIYD